MRQQLVNELMDARRAVKSAKAADDSFALTVARQQVDAAKRALGERGPTWWGDDPDYNQFLVKNTPYATWWTQRNAQLLDSQSD